MRIAARIYALRAMRAKMRRLVDIHGRVRLHLITVRCSTKRATCSNSSVYHAINASW